MVSYRNRSRLPVQGVDENRFVFGPDRCDGPAGPVVLPGPTFPTALLRQGRPNHLLPAASGDDGGVLIGATWVGESTARRRFLAGPWSSGWRGADHSVMTSVTAARAEDSSTMALPVAMAATRAWTPRLTRAWTPRLLIARGVPRPT